MYLARTGVTIPRFFNRPAIRVTAAISPVAPDTPMPRHRFNYESDPVKGGTWFGDKGVRVCDWSWDVEKKTLTVRTVRRGPRGKQVSLSVDLEKLEPPQELGKRLSEIALEAALRIHRRR